MSCDRLNLRAAGIERGAPVQFDFDGQQVEAFVGESVAAALYAQGIRSLRNSPRDGSPRGMFCLMGSCQECLVWVGSRKLVSCQVPVSADLKVESLPYRENMYG